MNWLQCGCGAGSDITQQVDAQRLVAMARLLFQMSMMEMEMNAQSSLQTG